MHQKLKGAREPVACHVKSILDTAWKLDWGVQLGEKIQPVHTGKEGGDRV